MSHQIKIADLHALSASITEPYFNTVVSAINNHVVRMGIMTEAYDWHRHPNSDETFIGLEGILIIETPEKVLELEPGNVITIAKNVLHRTRPKGDRSVNLTVESADMETVFGEN